jgi:MFS family permease
VTAPRERFLHELAVGWREVATRRWLWLIVLGASIFLLTFEAPMQVVGPVVMRATYNGAATWGLLGAAIAVGALIGAMVAPRAWLPRPMLVSICLFFATVVQPLLLLAHAPVWQLAAINVVVGMGNGMFDTVWHSSMQHQIPADRLARASAWDWMGSMAGMPIGFALAGFAVEHVGTRPTLIAMSVSALVICVGFLIDPEVRDLGNELHAQA